MPRVLAASARSLNFSMAVNFLGYQLRLAGLASKNLSKECHDPPPARMCLPVSKLLIARSTRFSPSYPGPILPTSENRNTRAAMPRKANTKIQKTLTATGGTATPIAERIASVIATAAAMMITKIRIWSKL